MTDPASPERPAAGLSRRGLLGLALGAGAAGVAVGVGATAAVARVSDAQAAPRADTQPFFGVHQSGITTEVQDHLHFAAFDVSDTTSREELVELLQDWSYAASRMMLGLEVSASG
ncbi:MAG: Dyp-type peroxidase, partial [Micrococcales bacterium]|nr:Dyp-type peroxidase [Micrococcales bacterium]